MKDERRSGFRRKPYQHPELKHYGSYEDIRALLDRRIAEHAGCEEIARLRLLLKIAEQTRAQGVG